MRVVLFDLPAHGLSEGRKTNLIEISKIIQKIAAREGHLHAVVAHSLGALCTGHAIKSGVDVNLFVSISAPTSMKFIVDHFCSAIGAGKRAKTILISQIESILKVPYEHESMTVTAKRFVIGGLIIHDRNDRMVPYTQAEELGMVWRKARLVSTQKLGHNRVLRNKTVIQTIVQEISTAGNTLSEDLELVANL